MAILDGDRVDSTQLTDDAWVALKKSDDRTRLVIPLCGARAIAKTRGHATKFFAHFPGSHCNVEHAGETAQHLAMKEALAGCINSVAGWHAIVESEHPSRDWIVDVLAESDDMRRKVAFEVQLSSQSPEKYFARSQRYFDAGVFPVWLVPRRLEYNPTEVPVVVTGFGKTSGIPEDLTEMLNLPADQDIVEAKDSLGAFVTALLSLGPSWRFGTPADQVARQKAERERRMALEEAERRKREAFERSVAETNDGSASPASVFGAHAVPTATDIFVWGCLTRCWSCDGSMLVWDARSPGFGKRWARTPQPSVKTEVGEKRFENHPEVHRIVNHWARAAKSDVPKAEIKLRRTKAGSLIYSAFVCPSCDSTIGQFFLSRILADRWSIIGGPEIDPAQPLPTPSVSESVSPRTSARCLIHESPKEWCDWCQRRPNPQLGDRAHRRS